MRFNALLVAASMLALGGLAALRSVRGPLGLALDDSLQLAVIHAEFALAPLLFLPMRGGRGKALSNLAAVASCWAAGTAVVLLFSFASLHHAGMQTRGLSAAAWLTCGGLLSLAARGGRDWIMRARVALLAVFGLPALWHYLGLEYAEAPMTRLKPLSPNWAVATHEITLWPLLLAGGVAWTLAVALPARRRA